MGFLGKIGHAIGHAVHQVGGLAEKAAPFVGMIPGVGTLAGSAIGGLGALAHGDGLSGALKYGAEGGLSGFGGGLMHSAENGTGGSGFLGKIGSVLNSAKGQIGRGIQNATMSDGNLDFGKIGSIVGAGANLIGQNRQRNSATKYNNAMIDQRNKLMSQITAPQNYNLPTSPNNETGY